MALKSDQPFSIPKSTRGRFHPSAQGGSAGIVLLVPRPVVDAEQQQLMQMILDARVQQLIIHLRRGGVKHLNANELLKLPREYKGYAPMHVAVMRGTSSIVAALLELVNTDPNVKAAVTNEAPLHLAAAKGDVGMTRALLHHGAEADPRESHGLTPLLVAAAAGLKGSFHHLVVASLLKANASLSARDPQGDTPLHLACDTLAALPLVNEMCTTELQGTANLNDAMEAINAAGESVLHRAIARKQVEVAALLLKAGARADVRSSAGDTPMHVAARHGLETIAKLLIGGAAGSEMDTGRDTGARGGERELAVNASNLRGETPLHLAMSGTTVYHAKVAKLLLDRGASAFGRTRNGESVLHACSREGNTGLAKLVLHRPTAQTAIALNAKSLSGGTPLHVAVNAGQPQMVGLLLEQELLDRGAVDGEGNTAINVACQRGDIVLLEQLLKTGRGVTAAQLTPRNNLGWAPLHTAAFAGQSLAVRLLLNWQAPVDECTADGWTALMLAAAEGHADVARSLLAAGATIDMHHPTGESALGLAAACSHHAVVRELLTAGAEPAQPVDAYGWTPFHDALTSGDEATALAMLERGGKLRGARKPSAAAEAAAFAQSESRGGHGKKPTKAYFAGDAIDCAPAEMRRLLVEADERRRRQARLEGNDSDSEADDDGSEYGLADAWPSGGAEAWPSTPAGAMLPAQVLLPPPQQSQGGHGYRETRRVVVPDRSGRFGAFPGPEAWPTGALK